MPAMFRDLRADEIDIRVAQAKEKGVQLLLYKDARCDQTILDETVGAMNWQRHHSRDNANCAVSIWDENKQQWIAKEDTGTESYSEAEKGLASDSFKRACVNWGIGRELYTAPFIWINAADCTALKPKGQGWQCNDNFVVEAISIKDKCIVEIAIANKKTGKRCYYWKEQPTHKPPEPKPQPAPVPKPETKPQPAPQTERPEPTMFKCEECGEVFKPYIGTNGKEVGVRRHHAASKAKFGKALCLACIDKINTTDTKGIE